MIKDDELLDKITVDVTSRKITLTGSEGNVQVIQNNSVKQFMTMFKHIRDNAPDSIVEYADI